MHETERIFIKSGRGEDLLLYRGFIYHKKYIYVNGVIKWKCFMNTCQAHFFTGPNYKNIRFNVHLSLSHIDLPDQTRNEKRFYLYIIHQASKGYFKPPKQIVNDVIREYGYQIIPRLGKFETIYRNVRRHQEEYINPKPYRYEEARLSYSLSITYMNEPFYRYGPSNYNRLYRHNDILIFYSDIMVGQLLAHDTIAIDGTFQVCPEPFYQLVTIGALHQHIILPGIYALLPGKTKQIYLNLLETVHTLIPNLDPKYIKMDYEIGLINALKSIFPDSRISGCLFHLKQVVERKIAMLGLKNLVAINPVAKKYCKALTALAFVERNQIHTTFDELYNSERFPIYLRPLYDFFEKNYIYNSSRSVLFPTEIWNSIDGYRDGVQKTNNAIEGYHHSLKRSFCYKTYSYVNLVYQIKLNESDSRILLMRINSGDMPAQKNNIIQKNILLDEFLESNANHLYGKTYVFDLLEFL